MIALSLLIFTVVENILFFQVVHDFIPRFSLLMVSNLFHLAMSCGIIFLLFDKGPFVLLFKRVCRCSRQRGNVTDRQIKHAYDLSGELKHDKLVETEFDLMSDMEDDVTAYDSFSAAQTKTGRRTSFFEDEDDNDDDDNYY